ncbi:MAG: hypothetical protein AAGA99_08625 [Actinomycetota bacterium]
MAEDEARIVSVVGGARRTSRWKVPEDTSVLTLFGRCLLDLRQAETDADELWFSIVSVFATVEVIVPEGTVVQPSGMAFLGGSSCEVPLSSSRSQLPPIEIDAITVFGSLRIHVGQRERVSLWRRIFRRGTAKEPSIAAPVAVGGIDGGLVDELRMSSPVDDDLLDFESVLDAPIADEPPAEERTGIDELDDVLSDVLGDNRDLLGATGEPDGATDEAGEPASDDDDGDPVSGENDGAPVDDGPGLLDGLDDEDGVPVTDAETEASTA